ncbi:MAG: DUF3459 domain-containing protein [Lachnospiraceae bacterium]|nr:DUF3459 domain-containing protein [Lachnospiraceae bacterium]
MPKWLKNAVFYEIYPQSYYDTNADGIGDFNGIIEKLDYICSLGCNALWINPCYDSPFKDAGYDVRDYKKVAPRYGTNSDLYRLFGEAHRRGMHVLLDLVPGHTSEEHAWFKESQKAEKNEYSNRYIWTNSWFQAPSGYPYVSGECERDGVYLLNFFKCQPALNYGFYECKEDWQLPMDHPDCIATREAMKDVMRFWLDHGCDGFRVDMADSLVKNDDANKSGTCAIWRNVREMLNAEYPEAAIVSEWSNPQLSLKAGFHMDFYLNHRGNGYNTLLRDYENYKDGEDHSFFCKDGEGDIMRFLKDYLPKYTATKGDGYISMLTCNHDTFRPKYSLSDSELKIAYAFIFTMPGVPFLYYGDEIGMRYRKLKSKEGGYVRTGSRTPMQWSGEKNAGFSAGASDALYLPVDVTEGSPDVASQEADENSLLHTVRELLALRHAEEDLQADAEFEAVFAESGTLPFVYRRGNILVALNPSEDVVSVPLDVDGRKIIYRIGGGVAEDGELALGPQSCLVLK